MNPSPVRDEPSDVPLQPEFSTRYRIPGSVLEPRRIIEERKKQKRVANWRRYCDIIDITKGKTVTYL